jgi:hypothetical protein
MRFRQFLGQITFAFICDKFGRRVGLYLVILVTYVGVTVEVVSPNYKVYTGAKVIMGLATGGLQVSIPHPQRETGTETESRLRYPPMLPRLPPGRFEVSP